MKTLLIMRHAKSSWKHETRSDHARPLNGRGKEAAPRMGQHLRDQSLVPDCILSSTAKRARSTAVLVADSSGAMCDVMLHDALYLADPETIVETIHKSGAGDIVLVVGHNPGMEMFVDEIADEDVQMVTAAIAHLTLDIERWDQVALDGSAKLHHFWIPRALD